MKGVYFAYAFVCYCYFTVAITGYWAFGQGVSDNVMLSIKHPKWVVGVADMFVVIHVFGSYQVCISLFFAAKFQSAVLHLLSKALATYLDLMLSIVLCVVTAATRHDLVFFATGQGCNFLA